MPQKMEPSQEMATQQNIAQMEAKRKACLHWVAQLQKLFPQTASPLTPEFYVAAGQLMEGYSEKVLAYVCGVHGIVAKQKYMPSIFELKQALEEAARPYLQAEERSKRIAAQIQARADDVKFMDEVQGSFAHVHVFKGHKRYESLVKWSETAPKKYWRFGKSSDGRDGIWVAWGCWDNSPEFMKNIGSKVEDSKSYQFPSKDELLKKYNITQKQLDEIPDAETDGFVKLGDLVKKVEDKAEEKNPFEDL